MKYYFLLKRGYILMSKKEASKYSSESKPVLVQESKLFESIREFSPSLKKPILILFISLFVISSLSLILFFNYGNLVGEASYEAAAYEENKDLVADKPTLEKRFNLCILSNEECNDGIDNDCDGTCDYQNGDNSSFKKCSSNQNLCPGRVEKFMSRDLECDSCWDDSEEDKFRVGDDDNDGIGYKIPGEDDWIPGYEFSDGDADSGYVDGGSLPGHSGSVPGLGELEPGEVYLSYPLHDCWDNEIINPFIVPYLNGRGSTGDEFFFDMFQYLFDHCDEDGDCYINGTENDDPLCEDYFTLIFNSFEVDDCDDVPDDDCGPWDIAWLPTYCDDDPSRSTCAYCINPGADEACNDGVDNDCNEEVDCEDGLCIDGSPNPDDENCEATETSCDDGFDNDADGLIDCLDDDDCQENLACVEDCDFDFDNSTTYDSSDVTIFNYMVPALNNASCGDENQSICLTSLGYSWVCDYDNYYSVNPFNDNDGDNITFAEGDEDDGYGGILCPDNLYEDCFDFDNSTTYNSGDVTIFNYMVPALNNASCGDENQSICLTSLGYSWVCDEGDYYSVNPFNDNDGDNITFAEGDEDDGYGGIIC